MPTNDTTACEHEWTPSPWEAARELCAWCPATREVEPTGESAHVVLLTVEPARRAA